MTFQLTAESDAGMAFNCFIFLTVWTQLVLACVRGEDKCRNELVNSINISTDLQSDVLLPCNFELALLRTDTTADILAVWSHRNITEDSLVEIHLQDGIKFWKNKNGRINVFHELSASGNFSLLLKNMQQSDLGLYQCELFNGTNCRLAYHQLYLRIAPNSAPNSSEAGGSRTLQITAGALVGGTVLLGLLIIIWICAKGNKNTHEQTVCNTVHHSNIEHITCQYTFDNPIYETFIQTETNSRAKEEKGISPGVVPVYAVIKKGKRAPTARNQIEQVL